MDLKVSFITGVKNRPKELNEMIESLINQDIQDWEAIIVNDHSEEPIKEVIDNFSDERLHYFELPENERGICKARNLAISHAQADILLTADGDDISRPQRARVTYEIMEKNGCDAFYSNLEYFIPEGNKKWTETFQPFSPELFKMYNFMTNAGTAFRKEIFLQVGGFDSDFTLSEDYDLYLRMLTAGGKFCFTEEILVNYRRNSDSVSIANFSKMHEFIMKTRIKNKISPLNIEEVSKYAVPEVSKSILTEDGRKLWQDDRFETTS